MTGGEEEQEVEMCEVVRRGKNGSLHVFLIGWYGQVHYIMYPLATAKSLKFLGLHLRVYLNVGGGEGLCFDSSLEEATLLCLRN